MGPLRLFFYCIIRLVIMVLLTLKKKSYCDFINNERERQTDIHTNKPKMRCLEKKWFHSDTYNINSSQYPIQRANQDDNNETKDIVMKMIRIRIGKFSDADVKFDTYAGHL